MRKKIIAGNWKMHGTRATVQALAQGLSQNLKATHSEVIVFPAAIHIPEVANILTTSKITWGAQNFYLGESGAFTGEISPPMLKEYGCKYLLVGHSERRQIFKEDLNLITEKFKSALNHQLTPILCIGETQQERESGNMEKVIKEQLASVIESASIDDFRRAVIAYEPVWAIGTGLTASPEQAQSAHEFIRKVLADYSVEVSGGVRILYGGSVKADNAAGLFAKPDIDGALVGGASLSVDGFLGIINAS